MTRGASEVGLYVASGGKQSAMLGFFPIDEGDAPESYGKAMHTIATVDGVTGAKVSQPYLGNVSPDMDEIRFLTGLVTITQPRPMKESTSCFQMILKGQPMR